MKRSTFIFESSSLLRHGTVTSISRLLRSHRSLTVCFGPFLLATRHSASPRYLLPWLLDAKIHASSHMHVNFPSAPPLSAKIFTCCACDQESSPHDGDARMSAIPLKTQKETRIRQTYLCRDNTLYVKIGSHRTKSVPFSLTTGLPLCPTTHKTLRKRRRQLADPHRKA